MLTVTDPLGRVTTNTYDAHGNLLTTADRVGNTTTYTYNSQGLVLTTKDALGNITASAYDSAGNTAQYTDALGNISTYSYDANGSMLTRTVSRTKFDGTREALTTQYQYDGDSRLITTIYPDGSKTQFSYNPLGKRSDQFDALGRKTHYDYDADGRLVTVTYADGSSQSTTYDADGRKLSSNDRAGRVTKFSYDLVGRLITTTYPDGTTTQTAYSPVGQPLTVTNALGNTTKYSYDDAQRRTLITDALGHVTSFSYDADGNQIATTDALGHVIQYTYDKESRALQVIYPDLTSDSNAYDALGRLISKTDQGGKLTQYGYDADGRLVSVTDALGQITQYGYDELGHRISQTDANSHVTKFVFDQLGRRSRRILPLGASENYGYDAAGNLTSRTDFNGHTTTYSYDALNRLTGKTADLFFSIGACAGGACGATQVSYTYTATGQRATMSDASGVTAYTYDQRDRAVSKATPFGTLSYTYDAAGNLLSAKSSNPAGSSVTYAYDQLNRPASVTDVTGAGAYSYDAVGNLAGLSYPNGVATGYSYDALNRLTNMQSTCATGTGCAPGTVLASYAYTMDPAGNRLSAAELSGRTVHYTYDSLYRLTSETIAGAASQNGNINYTYDTVGNRTQLSSTVPAIPSGTLSYDANDRLNSTVYDNNGNTINDGFTKAYDFENHLIRSGNVTVAYDGDGNRTAETTAGITTNYLVDTNNLTGFAQVVDELQSGIVVRSYTYGLALINERQTVGGTPTTSFYGYDGHGNVRFLTSSTGVVTDTYDYDAFGVLINRTGTTPNNYLYSGQQFDPALNLYYNRARYLNPVIGRFITMDTFEGNDREPLSLHKYLYADANAVNMVDPSGQQDFEDMLVAAAIVGILSSISALIFGQLNYLFYERMARGNVIQRYIFPFYRAAGFMCNQWIGTTDNPPIDRARPDCRNHTTGEVYEIKSSDPGEIAKGYDEVVNFYIPRLTAHDRANNRYTAWYPGTRLLAPRYIRTLEFPFIVFELSIPVDGVIVYTPLPDYDEAARYGVQMFALTLIILILEEPVEVPEDLAPPIEEPEPVPLPKAA